MAPAATPRECSGGDTTSGLSGPGAAPAYRGGYIITGISVPWSEMRPREGEALPEPVLGPLAGELALVSYPVGEHDELQVELLDVRGPVGRRGEVVPDALRRSWPARGLEQAGGPVLPVDKLGLERIGVLGLEPAAQVTARVQGPARTVEASMWSASNRSEISSRS